MKLPHQLVFEKQCTCCALAETSNINLDLNASQLYSTITPGNNKNKKKIFKCLQK